MTFDILISSCFKSLQTITTHTHTSKKMEMNFSLVHRVLSISPSRCRHRLQMEQKMQYLFTQSKRKKALMKLHALQCISWDLKWTVNGV